MTIEERLKKLLTEEFNVAEESLTDDKKLAELIDKGDLLDLELMIEDEFEIDIYEKDYEKLKTYGNLKQIIKEKLGES